MTTLVEHARRELELSGQTAEDPSYAASIVAAVAAFASYGHSGGSAEVAIEQLHDLLRFRPLSPLTSDPDEWFDQGEISGTPLWQNRRDSAAFSRDGGQTWYFVDDRAGTYHTPTVAPQGFGSPDDYATNPPNHDQLWCAWCGFCLHCEAADPCSAGTDGLHYWPPRGEPDGRTRHRLRASPQAATPPRPPGCRPRFWPGSAVHAGT